MLDRREEAAEAYTQLIGLTPSAQLLIIIGEILHQTGNTDAEIAAYATAIERNPSIAVGYNRLGALLEKLGRNDEAIKFYEQAVTIGAADEMTVNELQRLKGDAA